MLLPPSASLPGDGDTSPAAVWVKDVNRSKGTVGPGQVHERVARMPRASLEQTQRGNKRQSAPPDTVATHSPEGYSHAAPFRKSGNKATYGVQIHEAEHIQ